MTARIVAHQDLTFTCSCENRSVNVNNG